MILGNVFAVLSIATIPLAVFFLMPRKIADQQSRHAFLVVSALVIVACILVEAVLFNHHALETRGLDSIDLDMSNRNDDLNSTEIYDLDCESTTIQLRFLGPSKVEHVRVLLEDDAHRESFALADTRPFIPGSDQHGAVTLRLASNGRLRAIRIEWESENTDLISATLDVPFEYRFSFLRLWLIAIPALSLLSVWWFGLWRFSFNPSSLIQRALFVACCLFCLVLPPMLNRVMAPAHPEWFPYAHAVAYPFEDEPIDIQSEAHAIMFDAFLHGGVVQETPSEELLLLENPYDPTQRESAGVRYMFDYALYDGQYYVYFGLAPMLTFYLPFYVLMGRLPAYTTAALVFACISILGGFLCVWEVARKYAPRTSAFAVLLSALSVVFGSNILMLQSCADRYYLNILCMVAFIFLTLWAALRAIRCEHRIKRSAWFVLCALFTWLLVWSRPSGALAVFGWIVPLFILVLLDKEKTKRDKLIDTVSYVVLVSVGAATIIVFNAMRFGSPLEFGQFYQLTLEDIHYNSINLGDLPSALWYYLFDGVSTSAEFPWIRSAFTFVNHSGNFFYGVLNTGAFSNPITWGLLFIGGTSAGKSSDRYVLACALVAVAIVCLVDYDVAGVAQRYVCDVLPTLCIVGAIMLMRLVGKDLSRRSDTATRMLVVLTAATVVVASCLVFSNYRNFMSVYSPDSFLDIVELLSIWI